MDDAFGAGLSAARSGLAAMTLILILGLAGCGGDGSSSKSPGESVAATSTAPNGSGGLTYVALGDSWPEGAHCNGCRTFPQTHAEAVSDALGRPVALHNLSGQAQPYFDTPDGRGTSGLLKALRTDEAFRAKVADGDVIVISTGPNDGDSLGPVIESGKCGDKACVVALDRTWHRDFDAILGEIEDLRAGKPTAIRLVNAANAFADPSISAAARRGWAAYFEALTDAMCDNARKHDVVCVDVRPVLNGPGFEQPVNDSSQEAMDAVAELLTKTGVAELQD